MTYNPQSQIETVSAKSAAYTPSASNNETIQVTCSTAIVPITLPVAVAGRKYNIKKMDATTYGVTITPTSGTIDGQASLTISAQYQSFTVISDGTNYEII